MRAWGVGVSPHPSAGTGLTPDSGGSVSLQVPHQSRRESIRGSGDSPHVSALETALQNLLPKVLARPLQSAFGTTSQLTRNPATPALGGGNHVGNAEIRLQDAVNTPVVLTHPMHVQLKPVLRQQMQTHRSRCTGIKQESGVPFLWVTRVSRKQAVQQVQASLGSPVPPGGTPSACGQASGSRAGRQEPSEGHEAVCGAPAKAGSRRRPAVV